MPNPKNSAVAAALRRFRPRALPTLAMVVGAAVFAATGYWQQGRMHDKEALRVQQDAAGKAAPVALAALPTASDWPAMRYRSVIADGEYDARRQTFIDNKMQSGRVGYHVVTPLMLGDGRAVLVNRGWIGQGTSRADLPVAAPPTGRVTVQGRLAVPVARYLELAPEATMGPVWQNLDPRRFAAATGVAVLPLVVEQTVAPTPGDGLIRDWPAPDFGIEKHWIYMMQWYMFAGLAVVLWFAFSLRKSARRQHD